MRPLFDLALLVEAATGDAIARETLALISGGAAALGALVGGCVTGFFTLRGERRRQEFARETEARERAYDDKKIRDTARGAAREWRSVLKDNRSSLQVSRDSEQWWRDHDTIAFFPPIEERRLLASIMSTMGWDQVEKAEAQLRRLTALRAVYVGVQDGRSDLSWPTPRELDIRALSNAVIGDIDRAIAALDAHCS